MSRTDDLEALRARVDKIERLLETVPAVKFKLDDERRIARARHLRDVREKLVASLRPGRGQMIMELPDADLRDLALDDDQLVTVVAGLAADATERLRNSINDHRRRALVDAVSNGVPERVRLRLADPGTANRKPEIVIADVRVAPADVARLRALGLITGGDGTPHVLRTIRLLGEGAAEMTRDAFEARLAVDTELSEAIESGRIVVEDVSLADARKTWIHEQSFRAPHGDGGGVWV